MKYQLLLLLAITLLFANAEITQEDQELGQCLCSSHPFLPLFNKFLEKVDMKTDEDVVAGLENFNNQTAKNDAAISDDMTELAHLKDQFSCCNAKTIIGVKKIVSKIIEDAKLEKPMTERILAAAPRLLRECNTEDVPADAPETTQDFLKSHTDETTNEKGTDVIKKYYKARIGLIVSHVKRIRGLLTAICIDPCSAGDFIKEAGTDNEKVYIEKTSDDANKAEHDEAKTKLEDSTKNLKRAVKKIFEKYGKGKCDEVSKNAEKAIEGETNIGERAASFEKAPKSSLPDTIVDTNATAKLLKLKKTDKSAKQDKEGVEKVTDEFKEKVKKFKEEKQKKKDERKKKLEEVVGAVREKLDQAAIEEARKLSEQRGCTWPCVNCDQATKKCTQCLYPVLTLVTNSANETAECQPVPEDKCNGTWTHTADQKLKQCATTDGCAVMPKGCAECENNFCKTCKDSAYLNTDLKQCLPKCVDGKNGCETCTDNKQGCQTCAAGSQLNPLGLCFKLPTGTCEDGVRGCTTCSQDKSKCQTCDNDHVIEQDLICVRKCVAAQEGSGPCKTCHDTILKDCTECHTGFDLLFGKCVKLPKLPGTRRMLSNLRSLAEDTIATESSETGINGNVSGDEDTDIEYEGVDSEGNCLDEEECKQETSTPGDDDEGSDSSDTDADKNVDDASGSANILVSTIGLLFALLISVQLL